eukprot:jgi/Mesen1/1106/ME000123S00278
MAGQGYFYSLLFFLFLPSISLSWAQRDGSGSSFPLREEYMGEPADRLAGYTRAFHGVASAWRKVPGFTITESNFEDVIESMSNGQKELVFTTFSIFSLSNGTYKDHHKHGMTAFNVNFAKHLREAGVRNFLLVGLTDQACERTRAKGIPCYVDGLPWLRRAKVYYGRQVALKWYYFHKMVALGYHPVFLDNDVVVLKDPFQHWDRTFDFQGLSDARLTAAGGMPALAAQAHCPVKYGIHYPCMSTGIMLLRSTGVDEAGHSQSKALFQRAIIPFLIQMGNGPAAIRFRLLPVESFHNVKDLKKRRAVHLPVDSVMVHCGKIKGSEDKQLALETESLCR